MTRTTAKYLALLALAIVLFHWKTLLTDQFTSIVGSEGVNQTYAWLHFWVRSIWSGHLPLWDPYSFGGRPFAGETQTTAFYPVRLLFALFPLNRNDVISPRFYHEYLAFNRFLGACFMFALLREFRRSHFAAFVGACAFSMGGLLAHLPWPQHMESCIWLPAIFLFLLRSLRAERRGRALAEASLAGLWLGMSVLTGGVQFSMIGGICIVGAIVYYGAAERPAREIRAHWLSLAAILAVVLIAAFGAGAAQLLPSFEYGHQALRYITGGWFPMDQKIPYVRMDHGMWPQSIATGLLPVGAVAGGGEAWPFYIGVFPLFLAIAAIWKCWSNLWVRYLSLLAVLAFLYAWGEYSPLNGILYAIVPDLWMNREPSRFFYLVSFALTVLAAFGLDSLLDGAGERAVWAPALPFLKWISIACVLAIAVPAVFTQIGLGVWPCFSLLLIVASCGWFFRLTLRPVPPSVRVLLAAFILFDLGAFHWGEANKDDVAKNGDKYQQMLTLRQAAAFVKAQPGLNRVRVPIDGEPNIGDVYGVQAFWGAGVTVLKDFSRVSQREDLMNVRYRIKPATTPDPGAIYQDALWKVYEDKNAYPRAWLVHRTVIEPTDDAAGARLSKPGVDLHNVAIVKEPLPQALDATATGDTVRFTSYEADTMSMNANTSGAGLLVLSEIYYPGWQATVNGKAAVITKVDGGLRGVVVPAGSSRVVLEYVPVTAYTGLGLSFVTGVSILLCWIFLRRRSGYN